MGCKIKKGSHTITIQFHAPFKNAGLGISVLSIMNRRILDMEKVKEFISYGIVGVMTTLVNYIVYCICLKIGIDWLTSNSFAWMVARYLCVFFKP